MEFVSFALDSDDISAFAGSKWTLLLPAVTVGNVGQLAVDLMLENLPCVHVGRLRTPLVLPVAGTATAPPACGSSVILALEVYMVKDAPTPAVIVQQRAPIARGRAKEFALAILDWAIDAGCAEVLVLASANAAGRRDAQLRASFDSHSARLRVAATTPAFEDKRLAARARDEFKWTPLEGFNSRGWPTEDDTAVEEDRVHGLGQVPAFLPTTRRGAFVRSILEYGETKACSTTTLLLFVHEGDNSGDAAVMASAALLLLRLKLQSSAITMRGHICDATNGPQTICPDPIMKILNSLTYPAVWTQLFAPPPPRGLY